MKAKQAWKDIQRRICRCSDTNCIDCRVIEEKQRSISNALEALETIALAKREDEAYNKHDAMGFILIAESALSGFKHPIVEFHK